jgi:hypothetical protein
MNARAVQHMPKARLTVCAARLAKASGVSCELAHIQSFPGATSALRRLRTLGRAGGNARSEVRQRSAADE